MQGLYLVEYLKLFVLERQKQRCKQEERSVPAQYGFDNVLKIVFPHRR